MADKTPDLDSLVEQGPPEDNACRICKADSPRYDKDGALCGGHLDLADGPTLPL